jgi:hypothetical protein
MIAHSREIDELFLELLQLLLEQPLHLPAWRAASVAHSQDPR